ncbi:hypothetical protein GOBAR_AA24886 [Gossypium barbadense]|uniref:Uncharacterized protein n=1 Tax=Gossypium barbadense TaxID=3634 RepID=A0A2P5WXF5_GOSBA|nr:hypothetical protein GOBAR_AA24886 [Gossypium barbadense]
MESTIVLGKEDLARHYWAMYRTRLKVAEDVGRKGVVDSVRDCGNVRIKSGDAAVRVKAKNSAAIATHG